MPWLQKGKKKKTAKKGIGLWPAQSHTLLLLLLLLLLLNEFYCIYSCTMIITTKFCSISIPNPQGTHF